MPIEFCLRPHSRLPGVTVVAIMQDGETIGVIYPIANVGIKLVSAHIGQQSVGADFPGVVIEDDGRGSWPPIPSIQVEFNPSPFMIVGDRIVRLDPKSQQPKEE